MTNRTSSHSLGHPYDITLGSGYTTMPENFAQCLPKSRAIMKALGYTDECTGYTFDYDQTVAVDVSKHIFPGCLVRFNETVPLALGEMIEGGELMEVIAIAFSDHDTLFETSHDGSGELVFFPEFLEGVDAYTELVVYAPGSEMKFILKRVHFDLVSEPEEAEKPPSQNS